MESTWNILRMISMALWISNRPHRETPDPMDNCINYNGIGILAREKTRTGDSP